MPQGSHEIPLMAIARKRSSLAIERNIFARNAGAALELLVNGPHRDKLIARMFGVSIRMAQYLRAGKCWTVDRLSTASAVLGEEFDRLLMQRILPPSTEKIHERIDRLERTIARELAELKNDIRGKSDE
jgi:hypothetical protein